jgi:hypothetical protein
VLVALAAMVVLGGTAVAVVVGADSDNTVAQDAGKNSASATGAHRVVQAWGVDPASAKPAFERRGQTVSIAQSAKAACLLRQDENDHCYTKASIPSGLGFSVTNDCSKGSDRSMLVRGFAPEGTATVEVVTSDGGVPLKAEVVDGAFFLLGTTPEKGAPYPEAIRYLDAEGTPVRSQPIRGGDDLCLDR